MSLTDFIVIFDIDETLIHTVEEGYDDIKEDILTDPAYVSLRPNLYSFMLENSSRGRGNGVDDNYWGVKRPKLDLFLTFCGTYFKNVVIWSAATKGYVEALVRIMFRNQDYKPDLVMSRDEIRYNPLGNDPKEYDKPIEYVFERLPGANKKNCFFVDDRIANFMMTGMQNAIVIPKYDPPANPMALMADDPSLLQLRQWLLKPEVMNSRDVRTLDKSKIFNVPVSPILPVSRPPRKERVLEFKPKTIQAKLF